MRNIEEIERELTDYSKDDEIIREIKAGLVWDYEEDSKYIAQIYEKYREYGGIDEILEYLYKRIRPRGAFHPAEELYELMLLSRFFRESIKGKKHISLE